MFARKSDVQHPIFAESHGHGEEVVIVHGWGMHGGFFREFAQALSSDYRVTCLDLPGHGRSAAIQDYGPENIATLLAEAAPESAHWIAWSLGATLLLYLSELFPERVKSLVMIGANPKFSQKTDWPHAISNDVLDQFERNVRQDFSLAISRFLKIQTFGLESPFETYRLLKERTEECEAPDFKALSAGVAILKFADRRKQFENFKKALLVLLGSEDSLVPVGVGESLVALNPAIELRVIQGAGHLPFITHREQCLAEIGRFLTAQVARIDA